MADAAVQVAIPEPLSRPAPTAFGRTVGFFQKLARTKPLGFVSLLIILALGVLALAPSVFATHAPADTRAGPRLQNYCLGPQGTFLCPTVVERSPIFGDRTVPGSLSRPFGTDQLGRDNYSRIIYGARNALYVGFGAVLISSSLALFIGVTSGYFGGRYDAVLQRLVDAVMALPVLVVLLAATTALGGASFLNLIVLLGLLGGFSGSRVIRSAVIGVRSAPFLEAARVLGATDARIMVRHVVPNIFGPLMVQATIALGSIILAEAALSFLGFGVVDPDRPTWGQMLQSAQGVASIRPDQLVWPGLFIALAVFSFNMLGDALRDLLDPRLRGARGSFG
jgi:peptide/nickel transport system permease protein